MNILKKIFAAVCFVFFITAVLYFFLIAYVIVFSAKNFQGKADAVVVLGAAQWNGKPSPILKERINHALKIMESGKTNYIFFTGGYGRNSKFAESEVSKAYSVKKGISPDSILVENISNSTIENIYYARKQFKKNNINSIILVSDPMHMLRSKIIANYFGIKAFTSPTQTSKFQSVSSKIKFAVYEAYYILKFGFTVYILKKDPLG